MSPPPDGAITRSDTELWQQAAAATNWGRSACTPKPHRPKSDDHVGSRAMPAQLILMNAASALLNPGRSHGRTGS